MNTLLHVKVLHSKSYFSKSTKLLAFKKVPKVKILKMAHFRMCILYDWIIVSDALM